MIKLFEEMLGIGELKRELARSEERIVRMQDEINDQVERNEEFAQLLVFEKSKECKTCSVLEDQLNRQSTSAAIKEQTLLNQISKMLDPKREEVKMTPTEDRIINPKAQTWEARRRKLEEDSKERARLLQEQSRRMSNVTNPKEAIERLEAEVGLKDAEQDQVG